MATYVNDLRLKEIATGDESGTWGSSTNTNLELIGEALSFGTEAITTNADTHTTTVADGASDPGRAMYLKYTGTLDSACTITIGPNTISRMQFIENATSGSQNIIISQGSGANITIPPGDTKAVYLDGAGSGAAVVDAFASLSVVDLTVQGAFTSQGIDDNADATAITIDSTERVQIGKTAAVTGHPVEIQANSAGQGLGIYGRSSDDFSFLGFYANGANTERASIRSDSTANLNIKTGGIEALRIDSSQRVGIGTTSPSALLHLSSADPIIKFTDTAGGDDFGIFASASDFLGFHNFSDSRTDMAIDGSGNIGIGTTSPEVSLHVHGGDSGSSYTADGADKIILEHSDSVAMDIRTPTDGVGIILFSDTTRARGLIGYEHSADAFKINTAGSERMRIDSSGNVGIGTTSPSKKLAISDGGAQGIELSPQESGVSRIFSFNRSSSAYTTLQIQGDDIRFGTGSSAAERMRITSAGLLLIGATSGLSGYSGSKLQVSQSAVDYVTGFANTRSTGSENFGVRIQYPNATANGTSNHFLFCDDATAKRFAVRSNGGIENYQSNDVNLSDERVKKNIVDTPDTLEIIKNLKVRDFQYKDQTDDKVHTGLIAQETETVDASLVDQDGWSDKAPEGEEPYKAIYNTDLMFKMLKAIQEQQEQIEQLKTKIETLQ